MILVRAMTKEAKKARKEEGKGSTKGATKTQKTEERRMNVEENLNAETGPDNYECAKSEIKSNQWRKIIPLTVGE